MTILKPYYTASQQLKLRIRPYDTTLPLSCSITPVGWAESWINETVTCSVAEYDSNDFLCLSASIYASESTSARIEVYQTSGSNLQYLKLYQGNIRFTAAKPTVLDSTPFVSYPDTKTEYIIYES